MDQPFLLNFCCSVLFVSFCLIFKVVLDRILEDGIAFSLANVTMFIIRFLPIPGLECHYWPCLT